MERDRIVIAVGAVIEDEQGKILLVKHVTQRGGFWQGKWICPGGKLNLGERIEDGVKREVREETHLDIELQTPIEPFERIEKKEGRVELHVIYIDYVAKLIGGKLMPDDDVGEVLWVQKEGLSMIWDDLHEDTRKLLVLSGILDS
ncbi:MAG: NUDIX domain-containing protein [Thermodesulfobacteriota bacterium]|nr:NUDIX domain-containing protein [Thermodesulfobacteriota bacterium]